MGNFERQLRDLFASFRSAWRWRARSGPADPRAQGGRPRPDLGDLRRSDAGQKAEEMYQDLRSGDAGRKAQDAFRDLRQSDSGRKAEETLRDLRGSDTARKAQDRVHDFRASETGKKAEATIQEAEAAARAAYLRLRKSMGEDK
ncbi:MAG TPA: hypothetical protein VH089_13010 [Streptosporangiaceae bacterium]|nr:hypothetical protein [Streptosporangiaceae bacterium]